MKENSSALYSEYIIDGIRMDETKDPVPGAAGHDGSETETYLRKVMDLKRKADASGGRDFRLSCPDFHTRLRIASSLIDTLWRKGHFRLENVMLSAEWDWDQTRIGNMAAFYHPSASEKTAANAGQDSCLPAQAHPKCSCSPQKQTSAMKIWPVPLRTVPEPHRPSIWTQRGNVPARR